MKVIWLGWPDINNLFGGVMVLHTRVFNDAHNISALHPQKQESILPITDRNFREIIVRHDRQDGIFWCFMNQSGRPSYTYSLGEEIQQVQDWIGLVAIHKIEGSYFNVMGFPSHLVYDELEKVVSHLNLKNHYA